VPEQNKASSIKRKNFITINESFECKNCGKFNEKAEKTCRNHCSNCLYSLHVDKDVPGDRLSTCKAPMQPITVEQDAKKGYVIFHKCTKCGKIAKNKSQPEDNFDEIIILTQM